jgi:hypothetical protein
MKKFFWLTLCFAFAHNGTNAQILKDVNEIFKRPSKSKIDLKKRLYVMGSLGNSTPNAGINFRIKQDRKEKWQFYVGLRGALNRINNTDEFYTAPTKYRTGSDVYSATYTRMSKKENIDTLVLNSSTMASINAYLHVSYKITSFLGFKLSVEGTLDMSGINFGGLNGATYINRGGIKASKEPINILKGGTHDIGNLNSELLFRLGIDKLSFHAGYGYSKRMVVSSLPQILPNGSNDRFRNTTNGLVIGLRYRL